jgi:hypothetical protein
MIIIQPSASRTTNPRAPAPSSKRWATIIRPLCGLITLLFGQSRLKLIPGYSIADAGSKWRKKAALPRLYIGRTTTSTADAFAAWAFFPASSSPRAVLGRNIRWFVCRMIQRGDKTPLALPARFG